MGGAGVRSMDLLIRLVLRLEAGDEASMTKHRVPLGWEDKTQLITGLTIPGMWRESMRRNVKHEWERLGPPTALVNVPPPQNFH